MNVHITNLYGIAGTCALAQNHTAQIARQMGLLQMGLYHYPIQSDTDGELNSRLDGIVSALQYGDVVIFQSPTWNDIRYDRILIRKIKHYADVKVILWVHDVIPLMFDSGEKNLKEAIEVYNCADLLILPSAKMYQVLRQYGLSEKRVLYQQVWDVMNTMILPKPECLRRMIFTGEPERFSFLNHWNGSVPIDLFSSARADMEAGSVRWHSRISMTELLLEQARGGLGLVWPQDSQCDYYGMNQSYKFGTFLSSGIPVIVKKGVTAEQLVREQRLGFVVSSLEEAAEIVTSLSPEEYRTITDHMKPFCELIRGGWFTRKLLAEAIVAVQSSPSC